MSGLSHSIESERSRLFLGLLRLLRFLWFLTLSVTVTHGQFLSYEVGASKRYARPGTSLLNHDLRKVHDTAFKCCTFTRGSATRENECCPGDKRVQLITPSQPLTCC